MAKVVAVARNHCWPMYSACTVSWKPALWIK